MLNYLALNEYTYRLRNKKSGVISKNTLWCYGDIFEQILPILGVKKDYKNR